MESSLWPSVLISKWNSEPALLLNAIIALQHLEISYYTSYYTDKHVIGEYGYRSCHLSHLSRSSSDEPSIVGSSHPGSPYIWPAPLCFALLRLSWVHPHMLMFDLLETGAHVLVPTEPVCWLAAPGVFGSVLLVSFSWLLLYRSPLAFPHIGSGSGNSEPACMLSEHWANSPSLALYYIIRVLSSTIKAFKR